MDLASEPVILVLACELDSFKSLQDNVYSLGWLSKHRFHWDANSNIASVFQSLMVISNLLQLLDDLTVVREFTDGLLD